MPSASTLAAHLQMDNDDLLAHLLALSAEKLLALQLESGIDMSAGASIDGVVVTRNTYQAIAERGARGVPYISGSNRDEGTMFTSFAPEGTPFDPMLAVQMAIPYGLLREGTDPEAYLAALREAYPDAADKALYERVWTESFRRPAIRTAEAITAAGGRGWVYRFDLPPAPHGCEVAFTFNDFARPEILLNPIHDHNDPVVCQLAQLWSNTVLAFARTGEPNGAGLPHWSPYSAEQREVLVLDATPRIELDPDRELHERWGDG